MFPFDHDDIMMDFKSSWCLYYPIHHDSSWWINEVNVSFWSWWHHDGFKIIMMSLLFNPSWFIMIWISQFQKKIIHSSSWAIMSFLGELLTFLITVQLSIRSHYDMTWLITEISHCYTNWELINESSWSFMNHYDPDEKCEKTQDSSWSLMMNYDHSQSFMMNH